MTLRPALVLLALPLLAACNATSQTAQAPLPVAAPAAIPEGPGCASAIARYEAVVKSDHETGNVNAKVYEQIVRELAPARTACAGGRDAEARAIVASSKRSHGYPG